MSDLTYYAHLLDNPTRLEAFRRAIQAGVEAGDRVLDLGTGLGTYAFFAARAGARQVWAVDEAAVVHVAEGIARDNGLLDRVTFVRGRVPGVELPDNVDVLIFEDFPVAFLDRRTWEALSHVERHLSPDGTVIPGAGRLALAPAGSDRLRETLFPLEGQREDWLGLDWRLLHHHLAALPRKVTVEPSTILGSPALGPRLPLRPLPGPDALRIQGEWEVAGPGRVDALLLWFDLEVVQGEWITNAPGDRTEPWGQWALPLDRPLEVQAGELLQARVERETVPSTGAPGWLRWEVTAGEERRAGHEFQGQALGFPDLGADTP